MDRQPRGREQNSCSLRNNTLFKSYVKLLNNKWTAVAEDSVSEREEQQTATEPTKSESQEVDGSKKSDNDKGRDWLEAIKEVEEEPNMECEDEDGKIGEMYAAEAIKEVEEQQSNTTVESDEDKGKQTAESTELENGEAVKAGKEIRNMDTMESLKDMDGVPSMKTVELMKEEKSCAKQNMDEAKEKLQINACSTPFMSPPLSDKSSDMHPYGDYQSMLSPSPVRTRDNFSLGCINCNLLHSGIESPVGNDRAKIYCASHPFQTASIQTTLRADTSTPLLKVDTSLELPGNYSSPEGIKGTGIVAEVTSRIEKVSVRPDELTRSNGTATIGAEKRNCFHAMNQVPEPESQSDRNLPLCCPVCDSNWAFDCPGCKGNDSVSTESGYRSLTAKEEGCPVILSSKCSHVFHYHCVYDSPIPLTQSARRLLVDLCPVCCLLDSPSDNSSTQSQAQSQTNFLAPPNFNTAITFDAASI
ncbi:hypothetical protein WR25_17316 [Diploscapter pachys]|uniref:Uncharacterized protein n=1 Tax=Diploscapter pachys TaxID=2018661 RepID=A0A2A2L6V1_9BILA|nr:hypothetical protein WR25_17316 [Diploscapter pachys]